jgi:glyoxalase family protein
MEPLVTQGFHHITMISRDAKRTLRFYRDVLGLPLVKQTVNFDDPSAYHLYFGDEVGRPGTLVTFFEWPHAKAGRWGVGGVHHLALGVETADAQLKWKRWLTDRGVAVSGPYDRKWFQSLYFTDPDGQVLELATNEPGYHVDEPIDALGEQLIIPSAGHLRGSRDEAAINALTHAEPVAEITPDMRLTGIHHITGITGDIDAAHEFYTKALGLRLVKRSVNQDDASTPHWFWAHYDGQRVAPHSSYTLFGWPASGRQTRAGTGQTHHIAFRAANHEELLAWSDHLQELGIEVTSVMDREYFRSIYFSAPDGQLLEIATDGPGFAVDESPAELGSTLKLPAWLEPQREQIHAGLAPLH